jgi:4-amino-4-deoxy-L-arabinose transferase-like glycosyltransferase
MLQRPLSGGALLGTGAGVAFLAKGLLGPGVLGLSALLLAMLCEPWRSRTVAKGMVTAFVASLPWLVVWPLALHLRSPALFDEWLWQQNLGRFFGTAHLGADPEPWYYFKTAPLFAFPVLFFGVWAAWAQRRSWRSNPALQLCVVFAATTFSILSVAGSMRALYLLPILLPLSLLAGAGVERIPGRVQRLSSRVALCTYSAVAIGVWLLYLAALQNSIPAWLPIDKILPPPPIPLPGPLSVSLAVLASFAWLANAAWTDERLLAIRNWAFGVGLIWVLGATLLMPWINEAKSYRAMLEDMRQHLPADFDCVKSYQLGESEAAMLSYEGGITTVRAEDDPEAQCRLIWIQGTLPASARSTLAGSRLAWRGHRPGDDKELHRMFIR